MCDDNCEDISVFWDLLKAHLIQTFAVLFFVLSANSGDAELDPLSVVGVKRREPKMGSCDRNKCLNVVQNPFELNTVKSIFVRNTIYTSSAKLEIKVQLVLVLV